jgi:type VI secretion system secreted protein VgrG
MALSSPAGIAAGTPRSVTLAAGQHIDSVAERNQQITAGKDIVMNAGGDLGVFVHGGNLSQIAHQGDLLLAAQQQNIRLHADKSVQISASEEHVLVTAEKHITLMCGGAFIKMGGGDIEMVMPGTFKARAAVYDMKSGDSAELPTTDTPIDDVRRQFVVEYVDDGGPVANQPYRLTLPGGEVITGVTDAAGATSLVERASMHDIAVTLQGKSAGKAAASASEEGQS